MAEVDQKELTLLAAMAYGESHYKNDIYEEMAGIASVLIRQRNARGYSSMQEFTKSEPTYSFVVQDGNPRYNQLINTTEAEANKITEDATNKKQATANEIEALNQQIQSERDKKKIVQLKRQIVEKKSLKKKLDRTISSNAGRIMAYKAARNALEGGADYSGGAYFGDGWDVKTNYSKHPKVKRGIKITSKNHNVFDIEDNLVVVIKHKITTTTKNGKTTKTKEEIGRYDHIYESTAGHGGTIFWRFSQNYGSW